MFRTLRKIISVTILVFVLLILLDPAMAASLWNHLFSHASTFVHETHLHGPHLRNPIGKGH